MCKIISTIQSPKVDTDILHEGVAKELVNNALIATVMVLDDEIP